MNTAAQIEQPQTGKLEIKRYHPDVELRGAFIGMPMAAYLAAPGINSGTVKDILASPLQYKRKADGLIQDKPTAATEMGTALHSSILEGRLDYYTEPTTYESSFNKCPSCGSESDGIKCRKCAVDRLPVVAQLPWNNNAATCKDWYARHSDKPVLSAREAEFVASSFSYVRSHPKCAHLLTGGHAEISIFAEVEGVLFKCRPDYYKPGVITDLKSVVNASNDTHRGFQKAVVEWGWHIQAAINVKCCAALGVPVKFNWLALQKDEMPLLNVVRASQAWLNLGEKAIRDALHLKAQCEYNNYWPEWPDYDGTNDIQDLPVPTRLLGEEPMTLKVGGVEMNY